EVCREAHGFSIFPADLGCRGGDVDARDRSRTDTMLVQHASPGLRANLQHRLSAEIGNALPHKTVAPHPCRSFVGMGQRLLISFSLQRLMVPDFSFAGSPINERTHLPSPPLLCVVPIILKISGR